MLLDPETLALAPGVERLLPAEGLKTELFSCLVETNTPVCETALEARGELRAAPAPRRRARGARGTRRRRGRVASVLDPGGAADRRRAALPEDGRRARRGREGPARLRPPRPRRDGELRRVPAHARGIRPWLRRRASPLGELALPRRRGDRRALVAARHAAAAAARRPAAAAGDGGGLGGGGRGGRGGLHADLVGRASPPAARDARGADCRPGDVGRALRRPRRAGTGALRGAAGAGGRI